MQEGEALYAPWRMDYIRSLSKPPADSCFICEASASTTDEQRKERLVLWDTQHAIVMINRYPYTNGHLLVAPRAHKADLELLDDAEQQELTAQITQAVRLLKRAISAQGFNIGINLCRCAGAGLPGHLHHHIVPRWAGDVNFMGIVGEVRVIPETQSQLWKELKQVAADLKIGE
jgi:ATP adenylyltransferase